MRENDSYTPKKLIKTYISESNQNKITHTLSVESGQAAKVDAQDKQAPAESVPADENANQVINQYTHEEELELLNAPTEVWPPTAATIDAEAVAGLPIGGIYGQEGDFTDGSATEAENQQKD